MIEITVRLENAPVAHKERKKLHVFRLIGCITIPLIIIGVGGYFLYGEYKQYAAQKQASIQAEINKQLDASKKQALNDDSGDPFERYAKEINALIPYDKTTWRSVPVVVYNFQFTYPTNTTALVRNSDGTDIWILRRDGYMMRIQLFQTSNTPQQWYSSLSNKDKYTATTVTFAKKKDALFLEQIDKTQQIIGDQYIVAHKGYIFQIWYQVYDSTQYPDDVKRENYMLSSIQFL